jgi:hypothetical protein
MNDKDNLPVTDTYYIIANNQEIVETEIQKINGIKSSFVLEVSERIFQSKKKKEKTFKII